MKTEKKISRKKDGIEIHVSLLYIRAMGKHKDKGGLGFIEEIYRIIASEYKKMEIICPHLYNCISLWCK